MKRMMRKRFFCIAVGLVFAVSTLAACGESETKRLPTTIDDNTLLTFESNEHAANTNDDDVYTTYQIGSSYNETWAIPTDAVMAYSFSYTSVESQVQSYLNKGYKKVNVMLAMGRDQNSYYINGSYDGSTHRELVQKNRAGTELSHPTGDTRYIHPSEGFALYLADWAKKAIAAGASDVIIEEPDGWVEYSYSDYIKTKWQEVYGIPWSDPSEDIEMRQKRDKLLAQIFTDAYQTTAREIKRVYPTAKVYIATHSSIGYSTEICANNAAILMLPEIDGLIGQAWTDTSLVTMFHEGAMKTIPFENGYIQYSEFANYTAGIDGKTIFTISDAKADNSNYSYDFCRPVWEHNIVSQLLMPELYSFQSAVWSERGFTNAPIAYKAVQEAVYNIQNSVHSESSTTYSGTSGVGVAMSYNAVSSITSGQNAIAALTVPLLKQGIPVKVMTLDTFTAEALSDLKILILSYDFIKPEEPAVNTAIADWVKNGGSLLYVGGENYAQNFNFWWKDAGYNSPQSHLFDLLGLDVSGFSYLNGTKTLNASSIAPNYFADATIDSYYNLTQYQTGDKTNILMTAAGKTVVFEQKCESGSVIVCGVEPEGLSGDVNAWKLYEMLFKRACDLKNIAYRAPQAMFTERGDYTVVHTFGKELQLNGTYIDIFSDNFDVVTDPVILQNTSKLYKKITAAAGDGMMFTNSRVSEKSENDIKMQYTATNVLNSRAQSVYRIPESKQISSITVTHAATGIAMSFSQSVIGQYLRLTYDQTRSGNMNITINFS